jgi:hypothetical protein
MRTTRQNTKVGVVDEERRRRDETLSRNYFIECAFYGMEFDNGVAVKRQGR